MSMIDLSVLDAFRRLTGIRAFIEHLGKSMPEMERRARKALEELATQEDWDYPEYDVEKKVLDAVYRHSIPRYTTYSAIILVWSFIETQLIQCAERVGREKNTIFGVRDLKYRPLEAASRFLERAAGVRIQDDPDWQYLDDMRVLRNIIAHRHGRRGDLPKDQMKFDRLLKVYPKPKLSIDSTGLEPELVVSIEFCKEFVQKSEDFFKRLFISLGSQHSGLQK